MERDRQPSPDSQKQSPVALEPIPAISVHGEEVSPELWRGRQHGGALRRLVALPAVKRELGGPQEKAARLAGACPI